MTPFKEFNTLHLSLLGLSVLALASGCAGHRGGTEEAQWSAPTYSTAAGPEYPAGTVGSTTEADLSMAQRRTDITDVGPGRPEGDASSADPSETSSQGAGSRALVGEEGVPQTATTTQESDRLAQGGTGATLEGEGSAQGSVGIQETPGQTGTNLVIPLHKESLQVGKRTVEAGTVRLRKVIRTETVNQPVQLRTETLTVDREPATAQGGTADDTTVAAGQQQQGLGQPFQEQELTIRLQREVPMVQTQVVPSGQIVAQTQVQVQQTNIQGQVRQEDVVVDKGSAQGVTISSYLRSEQRGAEKAVGGGGEMGGQSGGAATSSAAASGPITDLNTLMRGTENPATLSGRQVQLSQVQVQTVVDPHLFVIGSQGGQPIYVRVQQPIQGLKEGATIRLNGTVQQPSETSTANRDLSGEATHVLMQQPIYVDAQSVQITNNQ